MAKGATCCCLLDDLEDPDLADTAGMALAVALLRFATPQRLLGAVLRWLDGVFRPRPPASNGYQGVYACINQHLCVDPGAPDEFDDDGTLCGWRCFGATLRPNQFPVGNGMLMPSFPS